MTRNDVFKTEINYIKSNRLKQSLTKIIEDLPDYFFEIEASSTGKYHPKYTLGEGGLIRHTKAVIKIAIELFNNDTFSGEYSALEKDLIIISLLIHDSFKLGVDGSKYTVYDHPIIAANFIKDNSNKYNLLEEEALFISNAVKTHMGPWTKDKLGNEVLEAPTTNVQKFVHLCDYIASRKFLNIEFVNNEIV